MPVVCFVDQTVFRFDRSDRVLDRIEFLDAKSSCNQKWSADHQPFGKLVRSTLTRFKSNLHFFCSQSIEFFSQKQIPEVLNPFDWLIRSKSTSIFEVTRPRAKVKIKQKKKHKSKCKISYSYLGAEFHLSGWRWVLLVIRPRPLPPTPSPP